MSHYAPYGYNPPPFKSSPIPGASQEALRALEARLDKRLRHATEVQCRNKHKRTLGHLRTRLARVGGRRVELAAPAQEYVTNLGPYIAGLHLARCGLRDLQRSGPATGSALLRAFDVGTLRKAATTLAAVPEKGFSPIHYVKVWRRTYLGVGWWQLTVPSPDARWAVMALVDCGASVGVLEAVRGAISAAAYANPLESPRAGFLALLRGLRHAAPAPGPEWLTGWTAWQAALDESNVRLVTRIRWEQRILRRLALKLAERDVVKDAETRAKGMAVSRGKTPRHELTSEPGLASAEDAVEFRGVEGQAVAVLRAWAVCGLHPLRPDGVGGAPGLKTATGLALYRGSNDLATAEKPPRFRVGQYLLRLPLGNEGNSEALVSACPPEALRFGRSSCGQGLLGIIGVALGKTPKESGA